MKTTRHILPAICITCFIMVIFLLFYRSICNYAEAKCWRELHETAEQIIPEITAAFEDDVAKLHIIETVLINNPLGSEESLDVLYLDSMLSTSMFSKIDVWYPDNTLLSGGTVQESLMNVSFDEIAAKGEHMTTRITDPRTGSETIYYLLPITEDHGTPAILVGAIDLSKIAELFRPTLYQGQGNIGVIDSRDGSFIIDSWHDTLGNAYEMNDRKKAGGYEDIDLKQQLMDNESGVIVFESQTTGESLYMYFTPSGIFDWQLVIFAPESVIFGYLIHLRREVLIAGVVIMFLLIAYFLWDIKTVRLLEQKITEVEEQKELLKTISYTDALTSIGNRMKYMEACNALNGKPLEKTGVIYLDLNGLKQINDCQSHEQGDNYIRKAANIISKFFPEDCYRIGGDEFVILIVDIDYEEFKSRIATAKKFMEENGISISIGYQWEELCNNLKKMNREAEKWMYKEKEAYYLTHDRRRR